MDGGPALLGRADLERIFAALAERLARRGVIADLFVVGGAAMAMAYDANRVTQDVDALFVPSRQFGTSTPTRCCRLAPGRYLRGSSNIPPTERAARQRGARAGQGSGTSGQRVPV